MKEADTKKNSSLITVQDKNVAVKVIKDEVKDIIKLEPSDVYSGTDEFTWGLIEDNNYGNVERVKSEREYTNEWILCNVKKEDFEPEKLEKDLDVTKSEVTEITDELMLKHENDCDIFMNENQVIVCNSIKNEYIKEEEEEGAIFTKPEILSKRAEQQDIHSISDMSEHKNTAQISSQQHVTCIHCHRTFKSERSLAEHTVKNHQKFSASVSYKIHQCTKCPYKTIFKTKLSAHIVKHTNPVTYYKPYTCIHCNATFTSKSSLDDHIVRKHPEFMESVLGKIHRCTLCSYKSTRKSSLTRHMVKHPETQINCSFIMCIHCNAKFKTQQGIDEHIVKEHPDFITTISEKIHECTQCKYKTTRKNKLTAHMLMHQKAASKQAGSLCTHCNLMFKHKHGLDEHTVRRHPDLIASVPRKIHECTRCDYKTTLKTRLRGHIAVHPELDNRNVRNCIHCNATFKTKQGLDEHIVKKHPDLIASLSRKIYSCEYCPYLTITKTCFTEHMLRHPSEISVI